MLDEVTLDIMHTLMDKTEIIIEHRFLCHDLSEQMKIFGVGGAFRNRTRYVSCVESMERRGMDIACHPSRHYRDCEYKQP